MSKEIKNIEDYDNPKLINKSTQRFLILKSLKVDKKKGEVGNVKIRKRVFYLNLKKIKHLWYKLLKKIFGIT